MRVLSKYFFTDRFVVPISLDLTAIYMAVFLLFSHAFKALFFAALKKGNLRNSTRYL